MRLSIELIHRDNVSVCRTWIPGVLWDCSGSALGLRQEVLLCKQARAEYADVALVFAR